ncbi:hypothetical protein D3C80_1852000 [compost metagenome]
MKAGVFRDEATAEMQVAGVIDFDVHLCRDAYGHRYIDRISECRRLDDTDESKCRHVENVIVEYRNGGYVAVNPISIELQREMAREMTPGDRERFGEFLDAYWGESIVA